MDADSESTLSVHSVDGFTQMDSEMISSRFEESLNLYSNDKKNSSMLQEEIMLYGLELSNADDLQEEKEGKRFYEEMIPTETLETVLKTNPHQYKRCRFNVENSHESVCKILNVPDIDGLEEIQISGRSKAGKSFNEDVVLVEVYNYEKYREEYIARYQRDINRSNRLHKIYGKVVGIFKRKRANHITNPVFVCVLDDTSNFLMRPLCKTVPKLTIIHDNKNPNFILVHKYDPQFSSIKFHNCFKIDLTEIKNYTFLVVFIKWTDFHPYPLAAVIRVIKIEENQSSALHNLRFQYQVPKYYQKETVTETEGKLVEFQANKITSNKEDRIDLTALKVFTIDPAKSKDLDDAISIERKKDGNLRVGVHIADVGAVINKDDAIDVEARERACTFYPGQGINPYHMLPEPFATNLCSLLPETPRPAITVFFTLHKKNKDEINIINVEVLKTIVLSFKQLTYEEVQKIIEKKSPPGELDEDILLLFKIAKMLRAIRMQDAMFSFPIETMLNEVQNDILKSKEAHYLVEEFMILANRSIAEFLWRKFPDVIPVRCQDAPSKDMVESWINQSSPILNMVLQLQHIDPLRNDQVIGIHQIKKQIRYPHVMPLQKWVWEKLSECIKCNDMEKASRLICTDELHPMQCLILEEWLSFQETAKYRCTGTADDKELYHFSLKMNLYVHFTSPIRRYPDLIVNRLIHAALENTYCPYTSDEVHDLCEEFNTIMHRAKQFQKQCQIMFWGFQLKKTPQILHGFVKDFSEKSLSIIIPGLRFLPVHCKEIPFNLLHLSEKPIITRKTDPNNERLVLKWLQRLYDITGKPVSREGWLSPDAKAAFCKQINPHTRARFIGQETWKTVLTMTLGENRSDLRRILTGRYTEDTFGLDEDKHNFVDTCTDTVLDHSSEVESGNVIKQGCEYSMSFSRGQIMCIQISAEPKGGIFSPSFQLFDMTSSIKHCLQHTRDPIKFFSKYSVLKPQKIYETASKYLTIWLPILEMEAVVSAVDENSVTINNIPVSFDTRRSGHFFLPARFCNQRDIEFSRMSEKFILQGESEPDEKECVNSDFLCLRSEHLDQRPVETKDASSKDPHDRIIWILHGQLTKMEKIKQQDQIQDSDESQPRSKTTYRVTFKLHSGSSDPSKAMLYETRPSRCSVEIIPKSETDVRTESILQCLGQSTDLAKKVALCNGKSIHLNKRYCNIARQMTIEVNLESIVRNNEFQKKAIQNALTSTFSLIHGPPGTGKTHTGIKLVYLFNKINIQMLQEGHERMQVVFCGPNNKSVDLVAKWMLKKYKKDCPDIIRLYGNSLENKVFPTPGKFFSKRTSTKESRPDPELEDISLHNLIRLNDKPLSDEIHRYDEIFRKYTKGEYEPTLEDLKMYRHLINEATQREIKQHQVVFCTTAVAISPRFIKALTGNIQQLIIDEAGMCTEPESIAAIIATKAKQVVLIGDHKQLRPVLKSNYAAELGLEKSLFERYSDRATMLRIQYRMHPGICEFPSNEFYDGRLQTMSSPKWDIPNPLKIWVNRDKIPIVFCHIEGEEEFLTVSTEEGNEQSCSNKREIDKVVEVLKHLLYHEKLDLTDKENLNIMSQYNAQCHQIRSALSSIAKEVNVNTVVASQGGEWNYVIFSTVRSLPRYRIEDNPTLGWCKKSLGFISDEHQINVALTRARRGLIIIGNKYLLSCDSVWKNLIDHYASLGCVVDETEVFPRVSRDHRCTGQGFRKVTEKQGFYRNSSPLKRRTIKKRTCTQSEEDFYKGTDREEEMHLRQIQQEYLLYS
ncbi:helicase with zinc finger domain 2-like [Saccostrea echinata]|uniref:helicase with zinc finger domain 2-like n=1 Tax=Saccostrea echinata TaxID=191078 RepID=UPI002A7F9F11|nr:helicase with zinc finger domain 2-like [Saccostrea echinata]